MFPISSLLRKPSRGSCLCLMKHISGNPRIRIVPEMDSEFIEGFENKTMTVFNHPGKVSRKLAEFDDNMIDIIKKVLKDTHVKKLLIDAENLCAYLRSRQPPITKSDYFDKKLEYSYEVMKKMKIDPAELPEDKFDVVQKNFSKRVNTLLKQRIYNWQPVDYTTYVGKQYLVNRMIAEYAALKRIFSEIASRNPEFRPTSLFDFGSGVGTATWTVRNQWPNALKECFNVDSSSEMNDIAELLLKDGDPDAAFPIPNVFYRQFLNSDSERKYNIVVASYSLLDLPSQQIRLKTLTNLWNKTEDFLVLVENGTSAGFHVICEARDFLLETATMNEASPGIRIFSPDESSLLQPTDVAVSSKVLVLGLPQICFRVTHLSMECSHELSCPQKRYTERPCCFKASYMLPPIGRRQIVENELYSFIVFRKGKELENEKQWPRVLKKATKKKRTARCRLCCPDGKLRIVTFTKTKQGKDMVQLLRNCQSCDRFPVTLREVDLNFDESCDVTEVSTSDDFDKEFRDDESDDESDEQN